MRTAGAGSHRHVAQRKQVPRAWRVRNAELLSLDTLVSLGVPSQSRAPTVSLFAAPGRPTEQ